MRNVRALALVCLAAALPAAPAQLTPEIAVELRRVTRADIDPAGRLVAYTVDAPRCAADDPGGPFSELWIISLDGANARRLTRPQSSASAPAWAPRGERLAFIDKRMEHSEHAQVFALAPDGGEAVPLTKHPTAVSAFAWSPNAEHIAFIAVDETPAERKDEVRAGRDWKIAGQGELHRRVWVLGVASGETRMAYENDLTAMALAWSPDGRRLVFRGTPTPSADDDMMDSQLYRVAADGGPVEPIASTPGKLGDFAVAPDSGQLAFLGATARNDPLPQSVFTVTLAGGAEPASRLSQAGLSCEGLDWVEPGRIVIQANRGTRTELQQIDLATGQAAKAFGGSAILSSFQLAPDGKTFVAIAGTPDHPDELFRGRLGESELTRLTDHSPHLKSLKLARQETIAWKSVDDLTIEGVLVYPLEYQPGAAERHPLVVHPHGGPEGVSQDGWNVLPQMLAARGFFVLMPNYRGSGGRGVDFSRGDHNDLGGKEFADILAGVDQLAQQGLIDPERVGIGGWSYGGYLSAFAATHHSTRFKAAIMGAGISNWVSFTGTTDIPEEMWQVHWNQPPEADNWRIYWERSPLSRWMDCRTPTLILHGEKDDRVPLGQAQEFHWALKQRGIPTQLVIYPRAGHGVSERAHRIDCWSRQIEWFVDHLR